MSTLWNEAPQSPTLIINIVKERGLFAVDGQTLAVALLTVNVFFLTKTFILLLTSSATML